MHIEPTNRCTLACPACPRTWFKNKFNRPLPKQDLEVDHLEKFLDCESGVTVNHFMMSGNHGDPIYYPDLFNLLDRFRLSKTYKISTNGSYQTSNFWYKLRDRLTEQDTVFFSIDGLEHNNHLYRKNSDWLSIMQGLDIMVQGKARIIWKTLIFSYNQNEIADIEKFATDKGAGFISTTSSRFGDETLRPSEHLVDSSRLYNNQNNDIVIEPQCSTQEYIAADGYYWPCCFMTSAFTLYNTELWKHRDKWSIQTQNLDQARETLAIWKQNILDNPAHAHDVCKMSCKSGQHVNWAQM